MAHGCAREATIGRSASHKFLARWIPLQLENDKQSVFVPGLLPCEKRITVARADGHEGSISFSQLGNFEKAVLTPRVVMYS